MNDYMIEEIAQALLDAGVLAQRDNNAQQSYDNAVKALTKHFENEMHIVWSVEDVQEAASEEDIDCSTERAREILADISHHHDVEYGVNWQTIRDALYESVRREAEAMKR